MRTTFVLFFLLVVVLFLLSNDVRAKSNDEEEPMPDIPDCDPTGQIVYDGPCREVPMCYPEIDYCEGDFIDESPGYDDGNLPPLEPGYDGNQEFDDAFPPPPPPSSTDPNPNNIRFPADCITPPLPSDGGLNVIIDPRNGQNSQDCGQSDEGKPPCQSIQHAIDNIATPGSTVYLAPGIYTECNIRIHVSINLVGVNSETGVRATFDCSGGLWNSTMNRVVTVMANTTVTISNIDFVSSTGGALLLQPGAQAKVDHCTFANNTAENGGAVYIDHRSTNNNFTNCNFSGNHAHHSGGGVYVAETALNTFENCTFNRNTAATGGGMYVGTESGYDDPLALDKVHFAANNATEDGGAIAVKDSNVQCNRCTMVNNYAGEDGGAIHASDNSEIALHRGNFTHNKAEEEGGALHVTGGSTVAINGTSFTYNEAQEGPFAYVSDSDISVSTGEISKQISHSSLGAIVGHDATITLDKNTTAKANINVPPLVHIVPANISSGSGSGSSIADKPVPSSATDSSFLSCDGCNVKVAESEISAHATPTIGLESSVLELIGAEIKDNSVDKARNTTTAPPTQVLPLIGFEAPLPAPSTAAVNILNSPASIKDTVFSNNKAASTGCGGALSAKESTVVITASKFADNSAGSAGAICSDKASSLHVVDSSFNSNVAKLNGGAIACTDCKEVAVERASFTNNTAKQGNGAAVSLGYQPPLPQQTLNILGGPSAAASRTFDDETVNPTAIIPTYVFNKAEFKNNAATGNDSYGGALSVVNANLLIENSLFKNNTASSSGGAVYHTSPAERNVTIVNTEFINNKALDGSGGAIYTDVTIPKLEDITDIGNEASCGGDFVASTPRSIEVENNAKTAVGLPVNDVVVKLKDHYNNDACPSKTDPSSSLSITPVTIVGPGNGNGNGNGSSNNGSTIVSNVTLWGETNTQIQGTTGQTTFQNLTVEGPLGNHTFVITPSIPSIPPVIVELPVGRCKIGEGLYGNSCRKCPKGTYKNTQDTAECAPCPAGYYAPATGMVACLLCDAGRYAETEGASECQACIGNYVSTADRKVCELCPPDKIASRYNDYCVCPPGWTQNAKGECTTCSDVTGVDCMGETSVIVKQGYWKDPAIAMEEAAAYTAAAKGPNSPGAPCRSAGCAGQDHRKAYLPLLNEFPEGSSTTMAKGIVRMATASFASTTASNITSPPSTNTTFMVNLCMDGYHGPMCDICDAGRFKNAPECTKCYPAAVIVIYVIVAAVILLFLIVCFTVVQAIKNKAVLVYQWRPIIWHLQIMAYVAATFYVPWPAGLLEFMSLIRFFSFDVLGLPLTGCLYSLDEVSKTTLSLALAMALPLFVPFVFISLFVGVNIIRGLLPSRSRGFGPRALIQEIEGFMILMGMLLFPGVAPIYLRMFSCKELSGQHYLTYDFNMKCYQGDWLKLLPLALAGLVLWVVLVPLAFFIIAVRHKVQIALAKRAAIRKANAKAAAEAAAAAAKSSSSSSSNQQQKPNNATASATSSMRSATSSSKSNNSSNIEDVNHLDFRDDQFIFESGYAAATVSIPSADSDSDLGLGLGSSSSNDDDDDNANNARLGLKLLFAAFKDEVYYWEVLDMLFTLLLFLSTIFLTENTKSTQDSITLVILFAYLLVHFHYFPYPTITSNLSKLAWTVLLLLTVLFGISLKRANQFASSDPVVNILLGALIIVAHAIMLICTLLAPVIANKVSKFFSVRQDKYIGFMASFKPYKTTGNALGGNNGNKQNRQTMKSITQSSNAFTASLSGPDDLIFEL